MVQSLFEGSGALAIPIVTFGNRSFDNGLIELRNELEKHGVHTIAGAAFAAEHAFSHKLAAGRPDEKDWKEVQQFIEKTADKIDRMTEIPKRISVKGEEPIPDYYRPLGIDGKPAVFGKVGAELTEQEGYEAARLAGLNLLSQLKNELGDLDRVKCFVKLLAFVASAPDFYNQPAVMNGASDLFVEVFGEKGKHARSAVG